MSSSSVGHLWHKPREMAAWMRRWVIVDDCAIRIYGTRNEYEDNEDAIYYIDLFSNSLLKSGSDNIVYQGWLTKKGKIKWNPRWCALLKLGYLNYIDPEQRQSIRSIDFSTATIKIHQENNQISWTVKNELFQFRCDSNHLQTLWFTKMEAMYVEIYHSFIHFIFMLFKKKEGMYAVTEAKFTCVKRTDFVYILSACKC